MLLYYDYIILTNKQTKNTCGPCMLTGLALAALATLKETNSLICPLQCRLPLGRYSEVIPEEQTWDNPIFCMAHGRFS